MLIVKLQRLVAVFISVLRVFFKTATARSSFGYNLCIKSKLRQLVAVLHQSRYIEMVNIGFPFLNQFFAKSEKVVSLQSISKWSHEALCLVLQLKT